MKIDIYMLLVFILTSFVVVYSWRVFADYLYQTKMAKEHEFLDENNVRVIAAVKAEMVEIDKGKKVVVGGCYIENKNTGKSTTLFLEGRRPDATLREQELGILFQCLFTIGNAYCQNGLVPVYLEDRLLKYVNNFNVEASPLESELVELLMECESKGLYFTFRELIHNYAKERLESTVKEVRRTLKREY